MTTSGNRLFFLPFVFLVVGLVVVYPALDLPSLKQWLEPAPAAVKDKAPVKIWANQRSGLYYCPDSKFYGKLTPGTYMLQSEAIQNGYQPAVHQTCR